MATHSTVLAWRILGISDPGGLPSMRHTELDMTEVTSRQQQVFIAAQDFSIFSEKGLLCDGSTLAFQSCASLNVDHRL